MSKSFLNLLGIALVSGSVLVVGSSRVQAMPEVSATSEQNINVVHSRSSLEEATSSSTKEVKIAERSETVTEATAEGQAAVSKTENSNPRIPCASRVFPSLMQ